MKRRAFKLIVFLLAGAIINVAVAWGCALWVRVRAEVLENRRKELESRTKESIQANHIDQDE